LENILMAAATNAVSDNGGTLHIGSICFFTSGEPAVLTGDPGSGVWNAHDSAGDLTLRVRDIGVKRSETHMSSETQVALASR
jgi:hypothetical protein